MSRRERIDPIPADYSEKRVSPIVDHLARYVAARSETLLSIAERESNKYTALFAIQKIGRNLVISSKPSDFEEFLQQYRETNKASLCAYYASSINGQFGFTSIVLSGEKGAGPYGTVLQGTRGEPIVSRHAMLRAIQAFKPKTHAELLTLLKVMLTVGMETNRDEHGGAHTSVEFDGHLFHFKRRSDEDMLVMTTIIEETRRDLR